MPSLNDKLNKGTGATGSWGDPDPASSTPAPVPDTTPDEEDDTDTGSGTKKPEPLSVVAKRGAQKVAAMASTGSPDHKLDSNVAQYYMDQAKQLRDQYAPTAPPETRATLQEALDKANQLYKEQANKNDWLEVAQLLGKAGAQFAGAQSGMANGGRYGRDMGNLQFGQGIDYNARTQQAARDRDMGIRNQMDISESGRKDVEDLNKIGQFKYKEGQDLNEKGLNAGLKEEDERRRAAADDNRYNRQLNVDNTKDARELRRQNVRDLETSEKTVQGKLAAAMSLAANEDIADDISSKDSSKLQSRYGDLAGKAGIDLNQVAKEAEAAPQVDKSVLGFHYNGKNPDAAHNALSAHIDKIKQELADIRSRKNKILSGTNSGDPLDQKPTETSADSSKTVSSAQLTAYSQAHKMDEKAAASYLTSQGYTLTK